MDDTKVTVYVTGSASVRKVADDCRKLTSLFDALGVDYEKLVVDSAELHEQMVELSGVDALPQAFLGEAVVGTYDAIHDLNEDGELPRKLRSLGYAGPVRGGEAIEVVKKQVVKKVIKKVSKKKKPVEGEDEDGAPPPPPEEGDGDDEDHYVVTRSVDVFCLGLILPLKFSEKF